MPFEDRAGILNPEECRRFDPASNRVEWKGDEATTCQPIGSGSPRIAGGRRLVYPLPSVSVVIVGYRSRRYLDRCLGALLAQAYPGGFDVVFVDNASDDDSLDHVRATFPVVDAVASGANLGYAAGNNLGAARARGEVLVFLNPDTEVAPGWLCELVRPLATDPTIGLTTSRIVLMDDPSTINACGNEVALAGIAWCRGAGRPATEFAEDADVAAVSGCSFAIRAELFRWLGGFDERFFMYLEDTDLSWRARVAGYRCRFAAGSVVAHDYRLSLSAAKIGRIERNRYLMLGKHLSLRAVVALFPVLAMAEILTWGYAGLRGRACLAAKARATGWAIVHLWPVVRTPWRPVEGRILREHRTVPPVVAGVGGSPSRLAQAVLGAFSRAATAITFALLPAAEPVLAAGTPPAVALRSPGVIPTHRHEAEPGLVGSGDRGDGVPQ
jgi:GT2 family glycosyltransferase